MQIDLNQSIKNFLLAKGFITEETHEESGMPLSVVNAYTSYCLNKLGLPNHFIPLNPEALPLAILEDGDFELVEANEVEETIESEDTGETNEPPSIPPISSVILPMSTTVSDLGSANTETTNQPNVESTDENETENTNNETDKE